MIIYFYFTVPHFLILNLMKNYLNSDWLVGGGGGSRGKIIIVIVIVNQTTSHERM